MIEKKQEEAILNFCKSHGPVNAAAVARQVGLKKAETLVLLDQLAKKGRLRTAITAGPYQSRDWRLATEATVPSVVLPNATSQPTPKKRENI